MTRRTPRPSLHAFEPPISLAALIISTALAIPAASLFATPAWSQSSIEHPVQAAQATQAPAPTPLPSAPRLAPPGASPPRESRPAAVAEWTQPAGRAESHLFHVALVLAERSPGREPDEPLPQAVQKALDDIRDFLPYSRYRVADSALVRTAGSAEVRLTGPDGTPYRADFVFTETEIDGETVLDVRRFALHRSPSELPAPSGATTDSASRAPHAPEAPLSASFRMAIGETVVVGSSRLGGPGSTGQRALIVLLTAVP